MTDPREEAVRVATAARERAYVPYSGFKMGAAVVADNGSVVAGALVENVSLGLAMCAERVALFATATQGLRPALLVLVAGRTAGEVTTPCGACLQVALELGGPEVDVVAVADDGGQFTAKLRDLLPRAPHKPRRASAT